MSRGAFNSNDGLWRKKNSSEGKSFLETVVNPEGKIFESKPLSSPPLKITIEDEPKKQNEAPDETYVAAEEVFLDEPEEKTVTFTESEYEQNLAKVKLDVEAHVTQTIELASKKKLEKLVDVQEKFFGSLKENLDRGDALVTEFVSLALKMGSLLARTQLTLDEGVIRGFVKSAVAGLDTNPANIFSIKVSRDWEELTNLISPQLPEGIDLIFDDALKPGDAILKAGQGGYFDLLTERINDIQSQIDSLDYRSNEMTANDFFQTPSQEYLDENVGDSAQLNTEVNRSAVNPEDEQALEIDDSGIAEEATLTENVEFGEAVPEQNVVEQETGFSINEKRDHDVD